MNNVIPLGPTLVELIGPSGGGKSTFAKQFSPNEIVSTDALRQEIAGDFRRQDMNDVVGTEFDRRIQARLEAGLRVVADATHIRDNDRRRTARLAAKYGASVIYVVIDRPLMTKMKTAEWRSGVHINGKELVVAHDETFHANEGKILNGDGIARVIDTRKHVPDIITPLPRDPFQTWPIEQAPLFAITSRGYQGILVLGDIHGNMDGLCKMTDYAEAHKLFILSLGDIVDYAPDTLNASDFVADLVFHGRAAAILGNHERKIYRFVTKDRLEGIFATETGFTGDLSSGNGVTVNQLKSMMPADRLAWETRFLGMCHLMPHFYRFPRYYFVHGAAMPRMLDSDEFRFAPKTPDESYAVFGETTGRYVDGFPERIYDWVNEIPARQTVVVGHDVRAETYPLIVSGNAGGRAVFLDTGSSKRDRYPEGRLSAMVLDIQKQKKTGFSLENERYISEYDL
jgi:predicted kinase